MAIDWFGFKKRHEAKKEELRQEIEKIVNDKSSVQSQSLIHDWDADQQTQGRDQRVSYRTLESIYKKESWVRSCIDAIYRASTSNGFRLVTKDDNDPNELTRAETRDILALFDNPNPQDSFGDIMAEIIVDMHIYGDAYLEIVRDNQGKPIALYNIYAPSIKILVNKHGTVLGYLQDININRFGSSTSRSQEPVIFDPSEMVHFKLPNPGNEVYGLSPLESLAIPIETDLLAQAYNKNFFKNNATPKLHVDLGNCTLAQLKRTKEFFMKEYKGSANAHKTIITEGGVKITPIGIKPADMEFLNQREFSRSEICGVMGVPPMKVGVFEDVNRASALESDKSFKSEKIIPLQRTIAKRINHSIISLFNQSRVRFEFAELDLRDAKEQAQIDKINIESGVLTINEARKRRGLPPIEKNNQQENTEQSELEGQEILEENLEFLNKPVLKTNNSGFNTKGIYFK